MAALQFKQRKTVNVHWSDEIKGGSVSVQVKEGDEEAEVRTSSNDGYATVTFPADFTGKCHIVVEGSKGGHEEGTVTVH